VTTQGWNMKERKKEVRLWVCSPGGGEGPGP